jgi:hypothetical protein
MSRVHNAPNLTAPRFRQHAVDIMDEKFYKGFKEKYPKYDNVKLSDIKKIVKRFNETLWETVIDTRDGVQLPEGIGFIFIGSCMPAREENIDYGKSQKYGVKVTNKNWETDGKLAKIFYSSYANKYKFAFRECWKFIACRNFKRKVAKVFPENWNMYVHIDRDRKMKSMYAAALFKTHKNNLLKKQLEDYNEFDL